MQSNGLGAGGLTEDIDGLRIAAELLNFVINPFDGHRLVLQSKVAKHPLGESGKHMYTSKMQVLHRQRYKLDAT